VPIERSRAKRMAGELLVARSSSASPVAFHGSSMEPLFADGDELVIEPVDWERITRGDIVTYRFEDKFPTRRVIAKRGDRIVLACDNWPALRFQAGREDILGRAVGRRRDGRWLRTADDEWRRAARRALRRAAMESPLLGYRALRRLLSRVRRRLSRSGPC